MQVEEQEDGDEMREAQAMERRLVTSDDVRAHNTATVVRQHGNASLEELEPC
jgi:phosphohistidine phosphatase SixA